MQMRYHIAMQLGKLSGVLDLLPTPYFSDVPSNLLTSVVLKIEQQTGDFEVSQPALASHRLQHPEDRGMPAPIWACLDDSYREMVSSPASLPSSVSVSVYGPDDRQEFLLEARASYPPAARMMAVRCGGFLTSVLALG